MIVVHAITYGDDVTITFAFTEDLREVAGIPVMLSRQITFPRGHPSYGEAGEIYEAIQDLVRDVTGDHVEATTVQQRLDHEHQDQDQDMDDQDEDKGMGE